MRITILGASGFVGGALFAHLKPKKCHQCVGTCLTSQRDPRLVALDVTDRAAVEKAFRTALPQAVIWCLRAGGSERQLIDAGVSNVINALPAGALLVYLSTDAVFTSGRGGCSENDQPEYTSRIDRVSRYANAKIAGEGLVSRQEPHIIVRTGPVWGRDAHGSWDPRIASMVARLTARQQFKAWDNVFKTFVHVDDLARAIAELVETGYRGAIHLGPRSRASYLSFFTAVAGKLGLDAALIVAEPADPAAQPLDTSLDTARCRRLLRTEFRDA
jgi:dTDP-4-dehydrorhamnose reductase